ncbi:DUF4265 domain-containing protein [Streptomyces sp. LRE541]|nr:DUF4265 domain-containing protein [Streptomyces sp. LRE541]UPZ29845.1 DUF4265 domain-containing protein [Streptomyces sp. LRE541]
MANSEGPYVKVHFRLEITDDWPPASVESLWAVDQGDGTARLHNTPWFVRGIAYGDIVATEPDEEGVRWAGEVVRRSENCTIRLIVLRDGGSGGARQSVLNAFHELGVCGEGMERFRTVGKRAGEAGPGQTRERDCQTPMTLCPAWRHPLPPMARMRSTPSSRTSGLRVTASAMPTSANRSTRPNSYADGRHRRPGSGGGARHRAYRDHG